MKIYVFPQEDISRQLFRNTRINQISVLLQIICDIVLVDIYELNVSNNKIILFFKTYFLQKFFRSCKLSERCTTGRTIAAAVNTCRLLLLRKTKLCARY